MVNMINDTSSGAKLTAAKKRSARLGARGPYTSR
jgi:hypothetical protein